MGLEITPLFPNQGDGSNATSIQGDPVSALQPTEGQVLVFDAATQQYVPRTATADVPGAVKIGGTAAGNAATVGQAFALRTARTKSFIGTTTALATAAGSNAFLNLYTSGTTAGGSGIYRMVSNPGECYIQPGGPQRGVDFSRQFSFATTYGLLLALTSDEVFRLQLGGKTRASTTLGRLASAGLGWEVSGNTFVLLVHDGTTLTTSAGAAISATTPYLVTLLRTSSAVQLWVNGALYTQITTGLPVSSIEDAGFIFEHSNGSVASNRGHFLSDDLNFIFE